MLVLGIDLETTTFHQDILRVTELGAVLYDTDLKCPIEVQADLINEPDIELPMDEFVVGLTGITDEMVTKYGKPPRQVINRFADLYEKADYIVAHNGNAFDKPALGNFIKRYDLLDEFEPKHWIDTMLDLPYGPYVTTRKLEDLTGRHGFLNPFPHRAFSDVLSMLRIMSEYPIDQGVEISKSPELTFHGQVDYHNRNVVKQAGFKWDGEKRKWLYKIKKYFVDIDKYEKGQLWDFPYQEIT
jgi:DNA polymerase-3 subunit epsilon